MTDQMKCPETWVNKDNESDLNMYGRLKDFCLIAARGDEAEAEILFEYYKRGKNFGVGFSRDTHEAIQSDGIQWFMSNFHEQFKSLRSELTLKGMAAALHIDITHFSGEETESLKQMLDEQAKARGTNND